MRDSSLSQVRQVREPANNERGFTLIELITVLVLVGIISAIAAPRFIGRGAFDQMGYYNEVLAATRYAQKLAVAQRRPVCVVISPGGLSLSLVYLNAGACNGAAVSAPAESRPMVLNAPDGISITGTTFAFDNTGQPITPAGLPRTTQVMTVGGKNLTIEAQTGYAHP